MTRVCARCCDPLPEGNAMVCQTAEGVVHEDCATRPEWAAFWDALAAAHEGGSLGHGLVAEAGAELMAQMRDSGHDPERVAREAREWARRNREKACALAESWASIPVLEQDPEEEA